MSEARINQPGVEHIDWKGPKALTRYYHLLQIPRFQMYDQMTHRTTDAHHHLRVIQSSWTFTRYLNALGMDVDWEKVVFLADNHDNPEIITDDIPAITKQKATPEERAQMKADDRAAAASLDPLVDVPKRFGTFYPGLYDELEAKETLESRIVDYFDKWDCYNEISHEIICGDYPELYQRLMAENLSGYQKLVEKNQDWLSRLREVMEDTTPDPSRGLLTYQRHRPEELDYTDWSPFIKKLIEGNSFDYAQWLRLQKWGFRTDFLAYTFPGWVDRFPKEIMQDYEARRTGNRLRETPSGLLVPIARTSFMDSLEEDDHYPDFMAAAMEAYTWVKRNEHRS